MKILVNEKISQHKYKTPEGYLICVDSVLARTGNQTYRKNEIFTDSDDDSEIEIGRSPEEVFSAETLASFENKPITIEHPHEDVNISNYKDYAVGFVRDVKQGKFEGQDVILGTLVITDEDAIKGIENGEHVELSCGYDCDVEDGENGYQQKHIRGNHVALCEAGRAGIAKIIDSVEDADYNLNNPDVKRLKQLLKRQDELKKQIQKSGFDKANTAELEKLTSEIGKLAKKIDGNLIHGPGIISMLSDSKVNDKFEVKDAEYAISYPDSDRQYLQQDMNEAKRQGLRTTKMKWNGKLQLLVWGDKDKLEDFVENYLGLDVSGIEDSVNDKFDVKDEYNSGIETNFDTILYDLTANNIDYSSAAYDTQLIWFKDNAEYEKAKKYLDRKHWKYKEGVNKKGVKYFEIKDSIKDKDYGGAYDLDPESYFSRDDLMEFENELESKLGHKARTRAYVDGTTLSVDYEMDGESFASPAEVKIDMRKIKKPQDLIKNYLEPIRKIIEKEYKESFGDSVTDTKKYAVEFTYDGDKFSNYLGQVWVYANSDKEALKKAEQWAKYKYDDAWNFKIVPKAYSNSDVIDSIEDAGEPRLDRAQRRMISNYLSMISGFVRRKDTDIQDILRPLYGKGLKPIVEKVEGWIWKKDQYAYKNYYISLEGYRDTFLVTLYADPNQDWDTKEVNAYFTDSVKDEGLYTVAYNASITANGVKTKEFDDYNSALSFAKKMYRNSKNHTVIVYEGDPYHGKEIWRKSKLGTGDSMPDKEQTIMLEEDLEHLEDAKETVTADTIDVGDIIYEKGIRYEVIDVRENDPQSDRIILVLKNAMGRTTRRECRGGDKFIVGDSVKDTDTEELREKVLYAIDHFKKGIKIYEPSDFNKVRKIAEYEGVGVQLNERTGYVKFIYDSVDADKTKESAAIRRLIDLLEKGFAKKNGYKLYPDKIDIIGGSKFKITTQQYNRLKELGYTGVEDSVNDVPNSLTKDINPDYVNCYRQLDKDANQLYKLYQHGDKAPSAILRNMGYKEVGDDRFIMRSGRNQMIIEFDDFSDYIRYYVVDETGHIPKGYTVTKMKLYDSLYKISIKGDDSVKLIRATSMKDAQEKYSKIYPKHKIVKIEETKDFDKIMKIIKR